LQFGQQLLSQNSGRSEIVNEAAQLIDMLREDGHVLDPNADAEPLGGGVSSEIYLVKDGPARFVVKRALAKLKVRDEWFADISRNSTERRFLEIVGIMLPGSVPKVYFANAERGYFGMEFIGDGFVNWKHLLLSGVCKTKDAKAAARIVGEIHHRTAGDTSVRSEFDTTSCFHQLRIEPYLLTTGARHPELQGMFEAEAHRVGGTRQALVHGDFSPKNILIGEDRMVLLDCEVAWYGDPLFDVAFLLNHFFLKALYHAPESVGMEDMMSSFWREYVRTRSGASDDRGEKKLVALLLMLMLARVDGKSPVEYLSPAKQEFTRQFVSKYLVFSPQTLDDLAETWFAKISKSGANQA
jgi:aminoglycoside phosphotransferase (APT) family kinase protein